MDKVDIDGNKNIGGGKTEFMKMYDDLWCMYDDLRIYDDVWCLYDVCMMMDVVDAICVLRLFLYINKDSFICPYIFIYSLSKFVGWQELLYKLVLGKKKKKVVLFFLFQYTIRCSPSPHLVFPCIRSFPTEVYPFFKVSKITLIFGGKDLWVYHRWGLT